MVRWNLASIFVASCLAAAMAIPASLVEEIKANEGADKSKVKRSHGETGEEHLSNDGDHFGQPTAIKRAANLKPDMAPALSEWDQDRAAAYDGYQNLQSPLFAPIEGDFDDKALSDYEKSLRYAAGKDKLDEALENAVLKSELYGEPAINQYRYYDDRRRKRRDAKKIRFDTRYKRDIELSPEDILTILTLYENDRQRMPPLGYRTSWQRFEPNLDLDGDRDENDLEQDDENWLDTPVYPHAAGHPGQYSPNYYYDDDKRGPWGSAADAKKKRFMVARKRNDPTRELRYLNGPNKNDFYTLSQLLSNQREPNVPVYRRLVL